MIVWNFLVSFQGAPKSYSMDAQYHDFDEMISIKRNLLRIFMLFHIKIYRLTDDTDSLNFFEIYT